MAIDEEQPLLTGREVCQTVNHDVVSPQEADADKHADHPTEWSRSFKWTILSLISFMAFNVTFACLSIMPSANDIIRSLNHDVPNKAASVLLITVWELGEAAGPLFVAPISETFGRYVVLNTSNALFLFANILTALSTNVPLLITARALTGLAVASNVLNPAIIGDMLAPEQRGTAMTIIIIVPMIASAVGPAVGGAVADALGWRQVVWINVALAFLCQIPLLVFFKETYRAPSQQDLGTAPRNSNVDRNGNCNGNGDGDGNDINLQSGKCQLKLHNFWTSAARPATMGSAGGLIICNLSLDRLYKKLCDRNQGHGKPEFRLLFAIVGALGVPTAVLMYGWTASLRLPLSCLRLSLVLLGMSTCFSAMSVYTYVVDAFGAYSASAMAGVIVTRCVMGAFVPLIAAPTIAALGYGWGFTTLGLPLNLEPFFQLGIFEKIFRSGMLYGHKKLEDFASTVLNLFNRQNYQHRHDAEQMPYARWLSKAEIGIIKVVSPPVINREC
ncbi:putative transporter [Beauveria bassiana]|nr:putative transporter [Beauveria bassiana]